MGPPSRARAAAAAQQPTPRVTRRRGVGGEPEAPPNSCGRPREKSREAGHACMRAFRSGCVSSVGSAYEVHEGGGVAYEDRRLPLRLPRCRAVQALSGVRFAHTHAHPPHPKLHPRDTSLHRLLRSVSGSRAYIRIRRAGTCWGSPSATYVRLRSGETNCVLGWAC